MKRKYELKRRAERMHETRKRIVKAAVDLHTTIGPGQTTVSALARRAGVQRHTVYAHFPTETELFHACTAHWEAEHPFPDTDAWTEVAEALPRLQSALEELYAWYESVEDDLVLFRRDAVFPEFVEGFDARARELRDLLAPTGTRRFRAAVGHAVDFDAWRSLRRQGLTRRQAVELMVSLAATPEPRRARPAGAKA